MNKINIEQIFKGMNPQEKQRLIIRHWKVQNLDNFKKNIEKEFAEFLDNKPIDRKILEEEFGFVEIDKFKPIKS